VLHHEAENMFDCASPSRNDEELETICASIKSQLVMRINIIFSAIINVPVKVENRHAQSVVAGRRTRPGLGSTVWKVA
jgi:hypothetical protein